VLCVEPFFGSGCAGFPNRGKLMKLATWNVNSLKIRLPQLLDWLGEHQPDVACLQEIKLEDEKCPLSELDGVGYHCLVSGQKTYNGVAILSKQPGDDVVKGIPGFDDQQKRVVSASLGGVRVVSAYVPNGQSVDSDKYRYKLCWLEKFRDWLIAELDRYPMLAVLGDYNIAPEDRDVHDPAAWEGNVMVSPPERKAFQELLTLGFRDSFRLFEQPEKSYTWWDYRMLAFRRNMGLRIDHILLSPMLAESCRSCVIHRYVRKLERPSDHAPVVAEIALERD
jgi:exodeoxyribonuclease III